MVRRKYAKLYCWLRLSYANQALNIVPSGTGPNQRIGRTIVVKEINQDQHASSLGLCRATVPSAAGISYRVDLILDKQAK